MKVLKGKLMQRWNAWCAVVGKETKSRNGCVSDRRKMDINTLPQQGAVSGEPTGRMMMMMMMMMLMMMIIKCCFKSKKT